MKKFIRILLIILSVIVILGVCLIGIIDRTPFEQTEHYAKWQKQLADLKLESTEGPVEIGWAKENITPQIPGPMAGYGSRRGKPYGIVHDSVFVDCSA